MFETNWSVGGFPRAISPGPLTLSSHRRFQKIPWRGITFGSSVIHLVRNQPHHVELRIIREGTISMNLNFFLVCCRLDEDYVNRIKRRCANASKFMVSDCIVKQIEKRTDHIKPKIYMRTLKESKSQKDTVITGKECKFSLTLRYKQ